MTTNPSTDKPTVPDERPCIAILRGAPCGFPEDVPIHKPAEGCKADGNRCDVPTAHHEYRPTLLRRAVTITITDEDRKRPIPNRTPKGTA